MKARVAGIAMAVAAGVFAGAGCDPGPTQTALLVSDFRHGLPAEWSIGSGALNSQIVETDNGLLFTPQPPNLPKGSIVSARFQARPGDVWSIAITVSGKGLGGGYVIWYDETDNPITAATFGELPSDTPSVQRAVHMAPEIVVSGCLEFGADTFGERLLTDASLSSTPSN